MAATAVLAYRLDGRWLVLLASPTSCRFSGPGVQDLSLRQWAACCVKKRTRSIKWLIRLIPIEILL